MTSSIFTAVWLLGIFQGPVPGQTGQGGAIHEAELFRALDVNGDGAIERGEVPEAGRSAFDRLLKRGDANQNSKLERDEFDAMVNRARKTLKPSKPPAPQPVRGPLDRNGDGKVTPEEFGNRPGLFARVDTDRDGFLSPEEIKTFLEAIRDRPGGESFGPRLKAMDRNGDGVIPRDEFTGPADGFSRLDVDGNGLIEPGEALLARPIGVPAAARARKTETPVSSGAGAKQPE